MRPGDTWRASFGLPVVPTGTPTAKLLHNGVVDTTLGTGGVITCTAGGDGATGLMWLITATIPSSGYAANDTLELSATTVESGVTQAKIISTAYIDPPVTVAATQAFNNTGQTTVAPVNATQWGSTAVTGMPLPTGSYTAPPTAATVTTAVVAGLGLTNVILATGTVTSTGTPTTTSFTATGASLNTTPGGYTSAPMSILWQTGLNATFKFPITGHTVSGSTHTFTVSSSTPFPNVPVATTDTFVIG